MLRFRFATTPTGGSAAASAASGWGTMASARTTRLRGIGSDPQKIRRSSPRDPRTWHERLSQLTSSKSMSWRQQAVGKIEEEQRKGQNDASGHRCPARDALAGPDRQPHRGIPQHHARDGRPEKGLAVGEVILTVVGRQEPQFLQRDGRDVGNDAGERAEQRGEVPPGHEQHRSRRQQRHRRQHRRHRRASTGARARRSIAGPCAPGPKSAPAAGCIRRSAWPRAR